MDTWERFSLALEEAKQAKKLDPVGQEDGDVDNDGDVDSSDKYLKNRRSAIGARISADRKKKVEEAKQLDPVGQEDNDIDNDGDHDKTDKYLLNRRKVRSKIIQAKEEVEQIDEIAPLIAGGLALGGALAAGAAIKRAKDAAKSGVDAANKGKQIKNPGTGIAGAAYGMQKHNNALRDAMKQLRQSYEIDGSLVEGKKKDDSYLETDMKKRRENNEKAIEDMKKTKGYSDMVKSARKAMGVDEEVEYIEEKGMSKDEMSSILKGHKYSKKQLLDMSKKSTNEGRHGEAAAFYHEFQKEETQIDEGMTMKDFKKQRSRQKQKEKRASDKIAPNRRKDIHTDRYSPERAARHRANVDPDFEGNDERNYPGGKLNPKKVRKAKALGELGEQTQIQEKALSKAQQRFMGMVYAAKKGETPASPEVAKAASGMSKKAARDFAKTKHKGLPEKKEETKESVSLVDKILVEASEAQKMAAKARREERQKKQSARMRQAKVSVAANKVMKDDSERKEKPKSGKGSSDPSAYVRGQTIKSAGEIKKEKEKTKRYKMRRADTLADREQKALKEREKERRDAEEAKKKNKQARRSELKQDIKSAWSGTTKVAGDKKDTEAVSAAVSNVGSLAAGIAKTGIALGKYALKKRAEGKGTKKQKEDSEKPVSKEPEKKETETPKKAPTPTPVSKSEPETQPVSVKSEVPQKSEKTPEKISGTPERKKLVPATKRLTPASKKIGPSGGTPYKSEPSPDKETGMSLGQRARRNPALKSSLIKNRMEEYSNWREEFILEVDDQSVQNEKQKIIDVSKKKNKIEINPTMTEGCGCDEKEEPTKKDMRDLPTQVNIAKNKMRSMGVKNPMVMVGVKEDWQSVNRKDKTDGLSQKAVDAYRRENPGSKLQTAVTEKKPTGKRAERRKSFCRRMEGMKRRLTSAETARDPDSRINKALRRWNCN